MEEDRADEPVSATDLDLKDILASIKVSLSILNGSGTAGVGKESATRLQSLGIDVAHIGNAKHYDYKYTNLLFPPGEETEKTARSLGQLFGIAENLVRKDPSVRNVTMIMGHDYMNIFQRIDRARDQ